MAINDIPVSCINTAAVTYHIPAALILSILKKENGRNGLAVKNKNGSYDLGIMQINTLWLPTLARYGYTKNDIQFDPCKNVTAGTWILAQSLAESKSVWQGVGNYNSHTPRMNKAYHTSVKEIYNKISYQLLIRY